MKMGAKDNYNSELNLLLEKAIGRIKQENPHFIIYTASIWTDRDAKTSGINFDSKANSSQMIEKANEYNKKYYDKYLAEGEFELAEGFKPRKQIRFCNPSDFELADFEMIEHTFVPSKWYPALIKFGKYAFFKIITELNVEKENFEFGINSAKDWYDKVWNIKDFDLNTLPRK
jgi:hypothetical protein